MTHRIIFITLMFPFFSCSLYVCSQKNQAKKREQKDVYTLDQKSILDSLTSVNINRFNGATLGEFLNNPIINTYWDYTISGDPPTCLDYFVLTFRKNWSVFISIYLDNLKYNPRCAENIDIQNYQNEKIRLIKIFYVDSKKEEHEYCFKK